MRSEGSCGRSRPGRGRAGAVAGVLVAVLAAGAGTAATGPAAAQDVLTAGRVLVDVETTAVVPLSIRDAAGTLLDEGSGPDREIQGFAFRIDFVPAARIASVSFAQAGVTAGRTPVFPVIQTFPDHVVVLLSFDEATDPLPFTLGAPPPGDLIGRLTFTLSAPLPPATAIALAVQPATATLVNGSATLAETVANGQLALVDGGIRSVLVFADSFESGDTSGWTATVP